MTCRAAIILLNLRRIDPEVWVYRAAEIISPAYFPEISTRYVPREYGSLYYRTIYYYSPNPDYPYVCLVKHPDYHLPLVQCCDKEEYKRFVTSYNKGEFGKYGIAAHIANEFQDDKANL